MSRTTELQPIIDSIAAAGFDLKGMNGTLLGALNDAAEVGRREVGHLLTRERRDAGNLADAVGRFFDGGCNDEEGLRAALTKWVDAGGSYDPRPQVGHIDVETVLRAADPLRIIVEDLAQGITPTDEWRKAVLAEWRKVTTRPAINSHASDEGHQP